MSDTDNKLVKAIKEKGKNLEAEMSFFDHLEVLRWHLIRSSIAVVIFMVLAFIYYDFIFDRVIMGPAHNDFWTYRMMCKLGELLHRDFCFGEMKFRLINNELAGQFTLQINSSLMIGLVCGVPYMLWEVWRFIKPALHDKERKAARGFVFYATVLFFMGVFFGYYIITPLSVNFLIGYTVSSIIENMPTIDNYLSSISTLTLGSGIIFELPIIIYVLSTLGIMTPKLMRTSRRYAIVIILIIAAIVTPTPDALTMTVVAIPLYILFETSILVAARVERRKLKREQEEAKA
jgi:sec-independent protein translocase protein TatC